MKKYLEIIESVEDETIDIPQMIRIEVSDKENAIEKAQDYIGLFGGKEYKTQYHEHHHEKKSSCKVENIKLKKTKIDDI
jgi:hypothetical protein